MKDKTREIPAVKETPAVKEVALITVKAINPKILEQLYPERGELCDLPYTDLGPEWVPVGVISTTGDVLLKNMSNFEIRLAFLIRYCRTKQDIKDYQQFQAFCKTINDSLPTIYVA